METTSVRLRVPGHDADLEVVRHGTWGRPVLLFPSEGGSARDAEHNGTVDAVRHLIDAGRMSLFCVDSLDGWSWSDSDVPTEERARRGQTYTAWLSDVVLPWVLDQVGWDQRVITVGVSLGAYHAVHLTFQRADVAPLAIGLSGNYDPSSWNGWGDLGDATYFANPSATSRTCTATTSTGCASGSRCCWWWGRVPSRCRPPRRYRRPRRSRSCCRTRGFATSSTCGATTAPTTGRGGTASSRTTCPDSC